MPESKEQVTIDIWQILTPLKIIVSKNSDMILVKNSFIFLIGYDGAYLIFKTEDGTSIKLHKSILDMNKIVKVF